MVSNISCVLMPRPWSVKFSFLTTSFWNPIGRPTSGEKVPHGVLIHSSLAELRAGFRVWLHVGSWYVRRLWHKISGRIALDSHFPYRHPMILAEYDARVSIAYLKKHRIFDSIKPFSEGDFIPTFLLITKRKSWYKWLTYERRGMSAPSRKSTYLKAQIVKHVA